MIFVSETTQANLGMLSLPPPSPNSQPIDCFLCLAKLRHKKKYNKIRTKFPDVFFFKRAFLFPSVTRLTTFNVVVFSESFCDADHFSHQNLVGALFWFLFDAIFQHIFNIKVHFSG